MIEADARLDTLDAQFFAAAHSEPNKPAIILPKRTISLRALTRQAQGIAKGVAQAGARGAMALDIADKADALAAFFGVLRAGSPAFLVDQAATANERAATLAKLRPALLLSGERAASSGRAGDLVLASGSAEPRAALPGEFYWGLSSGTTGAPKAFARCHSSWLASMAACEAVFPLRAGDVIAIPGPLSHSVFLFGAVQALSRGLTVALPISFQAGAAVRHFAECCANVLWCVPAMLKALVAAHGETGWQPRLIFCGGAKLGADLRAEAEAAFPQADIVEFYGASELSFITYASTSRPAPSGSVGRAFPGVELRVCPAGNCETEGLIEVRSPMLFSRYLDIEQPRIAGDWATAGDLGRIDDEGFLHLTGRQARIINTKALKVSAEAIEAVLATCPAIEMATVIGLPDGARGEAIAAFIVPGPRFEGLETVTRHCRAHLGRRQMPRRFFLANALPTTSNGKIAVAELRALAMADDPRFTELRR
jgi:long-chain acyl-CoA synthetase